MSTKLLFAITVLLLGAVLVIAVIVERGGSAPADRPVATADPAVLVLDVITDVDQDIAYRVTNTGSAPTVTIHVLGFYE